MKKSRGCFFVLFLKFFSNTYFDCFSLQFSSFDFPWVLVQLDFSFAVKSTDHKILIIKNDVICTVKHELATKSHLLKIIDTLVLILNFYSIILDLSDDKMSIFKDFGIEKFCLTAKIGYFLSYSFCSSKQIRLKNQCLNKRKMSHVGGGVPKSVT